jgi:hypothetical protein
MIIERRSRVESRERVLALAPTAQLLKRKAIQPPRDEEEDAMKLRTVLVATCLILSTDAQADGLTSKLITPTLWALTPDLLACNLTNVTQQTRTVQVRIISNGSILLDSGPIPVDPQHTTNHFVTGLAFPGGPLYCEFTVEGFKAGYRGAAKLFHPPTSSDFVALPAE